MPTRTATFWIAVFTALASMVAGLSPSAPLVYGFIPAKASGLLPIPGSVPSVFTPLTATLVHGGFMHLALNLLMLVWCGLAVERVLGRGPLLLLYALGAYASMAAQWLAGPGQTTPVIGASGAISAVVGAYALTFSRPRLVSDNPRVRRLVHVVWLAAAWTVLQLLVGYSAGQQGLLLATPAHVGGFVLGLALQRPLLLWRYRNA